MANFQSTHVAGDLIADEYTGAYLQSSASDTDGLAPARGIMVGILLCVPVWALILSRWML